MSLFLNGDDLIRSGPSAQHSSDMLDAKETNIKTKKNDKNKNQQKHVTETNENYRLHFCW